MLGCATRPARAQYLGTTSPQSVIATLATSLPCTGAPQNFTTGVTPGFRNLGQTQHYAYITTTGVQTLTMNIFGVDNSGNTYLISDTSTIGTPSIGNNPSLTGTGYYPNIRVVVQCTPNTGTFTLNYTGTSSTANVNAGGYLLTQEDKTIASAAPAATGVTANFQPPYGDSQGYLSFNYSPGAGPAGGQVGVLCETASGNITSQYNYNLTTALNQNYSVPESACPNATVLYVSGGATADTFTLDYVFVPPGIPLVKNYTHITGTTATVVKPGPGTLHSIVVGTPAVGTISLFDLAPAACTGTPITGIVSVITATATFPAAPEIYDTLFTLGICAKASATMDITVSAQ